MTAGRGVIHEEMPEQQEGLMRGFQLWINLPAAEKMIPARYQEFAAEEITNIEDSQTGVRVKLIAGDITLNGQTYSGPVSGISRAPLMLELRLPANTTFSVPLQDDRAGFVYLFEGSAQLYDAGLNLHEAAELGEGELIKLQAGPEGAALLLLAAQPINEPIAQYGPFVMNTPEEIDQAINDYRNGTLV
jgi:redox-sensitive bicupin YhaK (pirin superfamily)